MSVSDEILKIRNKVYAKALLEVSTEGDVKQNSYPDKCNITNKKTGERWSVEFHSKPYDDPDGISPTEWYAELKDECGKSVEKRDIDRYFSEKKTDNILIRYSGYGPIWDSVNSEFKKFQREQHHIRDDERKNRHNAEVVLAMKKLENFLKKQK